MSVLVDIPEMFGSMVFDEEKMKDRLPENIYNNLMLTIKNGKRLSLDVANVIAKAMKDWAVENGATHFTHWFQPMTGVTAEKHDSFIEFDKNGKVIMEFSGKMLVQGEPDASSLPTGGLRSTFEARGYTAWDPTSYAFIKDGSLCIPTAFFSYGGESLDKKTPLLRSMEAIDTQVKRILALFGETVTERVVTTVGPEQEYFLIDKKVYEKRPDLIYCNRTLFGAKPPKGQQLDDHYFGKIKPRVSEYMKDLDNELWKLGILSKTKHNETAPAQHEMAPVFTTANIATDHNQLVMELMKTVANRHGMVCLLHEKPFEGVNGSGKHNNWSLSLNGGTNLLEPGDTPSQNARFMLFITAVILAVDEYQDLLRIAVAGAGNDCRLGAGEAPPAIVSMFLGDELTEIIDAISSGCLYHEKERTAIEIGAKVLPRLPKDTTDRNRTSPFAFTGNKFEFRMLGASQSIADTNTFLNTIVAEALCRLADKLENTTDFTSGLTEVIRETLCKHRRIIFNGNNYSKEWVKEAENRKLSNYDSTASAVPHLLDDKNVKLFEKHKVLTGAELKSHCDILLDEYCKSIRIEARTMVEMTKRGVIPAVVKYQKMLAGSAKLKKDINPDLDAALEEALLKELSELSSDLLSKLSVLEENTRAAKRPEGNDKNTAMYYRENVVTAINAVRLIADRIETLVDKDLWAYPTYGEILYSVS